MKSQWERWEERAKKEGLEQPTRPGWCPDCGEHRGERCHRNAAGELVMDWGCTMEVQGFEDCVPDCQECGGKGGEE